MYRGQIEAMKLVDVVENHEHRFLRREDHIHKPISRGRRLAGQSVNHSPPVLLSPIGHFQTGAGLANPAWPTNEHRSPRLGGEGLPDTVRVSLVQDWRRHVGKAGID